MRKHPASMTRFTDNGGVTLSPEALAYAKELAAEIVAAGNPHGDLLAEMEAAHQRRQAFAAEMAEGRTDRAKAFRGAMARAVASRDPGQ